MEMSPSGGAAKVYKYFHIYIYIYIYIVRVQNLKNFCDFAGNNYAKLLEHGNTRFLSLGPSIDRILSMFDGIRLYFLSQEKCPVMFHGIWTTFQRLMISVLPVWHSKLLFGTMDSEDASYYADKISNLEKEQIDFLKILMEEMTIVRPKLRSMNSSSVDVFKDELLI
jgi:hypothetical protein